MSDLSSFSPLSAAMNGINPSHSSTNRVPAVAPAFKLNEIDASTAASRLSPALSDSVSTAGADRVELSSHARFLDMLRNMPSVRQPLIDRVRAEIDTGTYETDEKIDAAIEGWASEEL